MDSSSELNLDTLSAFFHLPISEAAKEIGVCTTVLKKICRKHGIPRWPHRKIKSLTKMITTLQSSLGKNPDEDSKIHDEIRQLMQHRDHVMKNPNTIVASKPTNLPKRRRETKVAPKQEPVDTPYLLPGGETHMTEYMTPINQAESVDYYEDNGYIALSSYNQYVEHQLRFGVTPSWQMQGPNGTYYIIVPSGTAQQYAASGPVLPQQPQPQPQQQQQPQQPPPTVVAPIPVSIPVPNSLLPAGYSM